MNITASQQKKRKKEHLFFASKADRHSYPVATGQTIFNFSTSQHIYLSRIYWANPFDPYMPADGIEIGVMK